MVVVVKKKSEITEKDCIGLKDRPDIRERWLEWVILDDRIPFDSFETEEEAKKVAALLEKARRVVEHVEHSAEQCADTEMQLLTEEERQFLKEYTGGTIKIEIEI